MSLLTVLLFGTALAAMAGALVHAAALRRGARGSSFEFRWRLIVAFVLLFSAAYAGALARVIMVPGGPFEAAVGGVFLFGALFVWAALGLFRTASGDIAARLQAVLDAASETSVISTDPEGTVTVFNKGAERMLGWSAGEVVGKLTPAVIHVAAEVEAHGRELEAKYGRPFRGFEVFVEEARRGGHETREWTYVRKDGSTLPVSLTVTALRDHAGEVVGFLGVAVDLTERRRAEAEKAAARAFLDSVIEAIPYMVFVKDAADLRFVRFNKAGEELLGIPRSELIGKSDRDFFPPEQAEFFVDKDREVLAGDSAIEIPEEPIETKRGERLLHTRKIPIKGPDGRPLYLLGVSEDITEQRMAEEALRRRDAQLRAETEKARDAALGLARAKSEFLANMSHEIRTPMNGVIGMTSLLLETGLDPAQREYAETIRRSGETLLGIINNILDFSKLEAGRVALEQVDFDLRELCDDVVQLLATNGALKGIEVAAVAAPDLPRWIQGDPTRLKQILVNLVGNAVKFTDRGGVVLRVSGEPGGDGRVRLAFEVKDTGLGIAPEVLVSLFQPFTQADATTTRRYGGTGLGLSISKRLAELMGGSLEASSTPGKGSVFTVRLSAREGTAVAPGPRREADLRGLRVLVVDDNEVNRTVFMEYCAGWGLEAGAAAGVDEALAVMRRAADEGRPFSAALIDMQMPGRDGMSLLSEMAADPKLRGVRRLVATSTGLDRRAEAEALGAAAYLVKPVRQSSLFDALAGIVPEPAAKPAEVKPGEACSMRRVLVAEDNPVNQRVAVSMLNRLGFGADVVADGAEAVEAAKTGRYALIMMDCQMPVKDGYAAAGEIRAMGGAFSSLPIVAVTANVMPGDREKALAAGMDDYLAKPLRIEDLASMLKRWLGAVEEAVGGGAPGGEGVLDAAALAGLRVLGDGEVPREIVATYLGDAPARLAEVRRALGAGDAAALARAAHTLKGSSRTMGARRLGDLLERVERAAKAGELAGLAATVDALDGEFQLVRKALEKL